jgi:HD-GYP domain-containing protein (c-di-GMP phosphodiesterase class II)
MDSNETNSKKELDDIYQVLMDTVRYSINTKIDKGKIDVILGRVADAFAKDPYNELLLHFYTVSNDNYIYGHIANNVVLAVGYATNLGLNRQDINDIAWCAFAHDFSMTEYQELFQKSSQLTPQELLSIQGHTQKSYDIFKPYLSENILNAILDIHECANGQGYPKGKTSSQISFLAKIVSICDIFEALTHPRSFRTEFSPYAAIKMIIKKKDVIFEKNVVKKFVEFMSIYPIGSFVHINTGEVAMVIASNPQFPTRSILRVLINAQKEVQSNGRVINLLNDPMLYISGVVSSKEEKEINNALSIRGRG